MREETARDKVVMGAALVLLLVHGAVAGQPAPM